MASRTRRGSLIESDFSGPALLTMERASRPEI